MKALLVILLSIYIIGCDETSSPQVDAFNQSPAIDDSLPSVTPTPTPIPFTSPQSSVEAEQVFRGTYKEVGNQANYITIYSNFTAEGSITTTSRINSGGIYYDNVATTCTFQASTFTVTKPTNFQLQFTLSAASHIYGSGQYANDCIQQGAQKFDVVAWPSEKCVDLVFEVSTGTKHYCKD